MTKSSKMVADRMAVNRSLTSSVEQHGGAVAEPLAQLLFPDGVPDQLTFVMLIAALGAASDRAHAATADADLALSEELSDDTEARDARDGAHDNLGVALQRAKGAAIAGWGQRGAERLGLATISDDGDQRIMQARASSSLFTTASLEAPAIPIDRAQLATQLTEAADRLEEALTSVKREEREAQAARSARDTADAKARRVYTGFADAFAGFAYAVGLDDVAARVKPTARRRAGLPEDTDVLPTDPPQP
jgi:hypothetical protein